MLGSVFDRLRGRRGASGGKAIVTWVSIVFGHGDSREFTGTFGLGVRSRRTFDGLLGLAFASTDGRRGRSDLTTYFGKNSGTFGCGLMRSRRTFNRLLGLAFATYCKLTVLLRFGGWFPGRLHDARGRGFGRTANGFVATESTVYGRFTTTRVNLSFNVRRTDGLRSIVNLGR